MDRNLLRNRLAGPVCCLGLAMVCFGPVLFGAFQFAYRDVGHYYYPLNKLVQREWDAGRWPLWEPEENAGMPLLGNPTAAVLYPGKLIFACFAYPLAAKLYIVGHVILAFATMSILLSSLGISRAGAVIGSLTYAFGAPVLFQYCNIIFLIGAAWLPLGFYAADRWIRSGRRSGLLELAVVLAMQILGGDPQTAYLLGLSAAGYAIQLAWLRTRKVDVQPREWTDAETEFENTKTSPYSGGKWSKRLLILAVFGAWFAGTVILGVVFPMLRPEGRPTRILPWMRWAPQVVLVGWIALAAVYWHRSRSDHLGRRRLLTMLSGLVGSAILSIGLGAAQLLPVAEFIRQTSRAAEEGPHDIYPFSMEPYMLAQQVWPNIYGTHFPTNTFWLISFPIPSFSRSLWVPSLYVGGGGLILALSVLGFRGGPPWRVWFSTIVLVATLGSMGQYTSPIWITRALIYWFSDDATRTAAYDTNSHLKLKELRGKIPGLYSWIDMGPIDAHDTTAVRRDGYLRDGDGSFYWGLSMFLPGFRQFRYPAKMMTFACAGLSVLAGFGWDRLALAGRHRTRCIAVSIMVITTALLGLVTAGRSAIIAVFATNNSGSSYGLFDPAQAYNGVVFSLLHTFVTIGLLIGILRLVASRPRLASSLALFVISADLAVANARLVMSVPQAVFDSTPEVLRIIREAERGKPADGPYRIHRMPIWNPMGWINKASGQRVQEFTKWERDTLQPKYGITEGIEYTRTMGVSELYEYEWYFGGFHRPASPAVARMLGITPGAPIVYYPRRAFDMWNTRYFVVPDFAKNWSDAARGYASFLPNSELIYPEAERFQGPSGAERRRAWIETDDYRILRNEHAYPRAWIVHQLRSLKKTTELNRDNRQDSIQEILYPNDLFWNGDPNLTVHDPRQTAWVEAEDFESLGAFVGAGPARNSESVKVAYPTPQRVEMECTLESPGMVVLSDIYYPGWELTIDDQPSTIYRVNRIMRGAAVPSGKHKLAYKFDPTSFRLGRIISIASLTASALLFVFFRIGSFFLHCPSRR